MREVHERVRREAGEPAAELLRQPRHRDAVAEQRGRHHQRHDHARRLDRVEDHLRQVGEAELAVDEQPEHQRVDDRHRRRLGGREDAGEEPAEEHDRRHQRPESPPERDPQRAHALERMPRQVAADREVPHHHHQRPRHQQAGDDAGEEQRADGGFRGHAVDDHRQRRRDDGTDGGRGRRDRAGRFRVVALALHRLDLDGAEPRRVRDGRAAHAGEDHAADDVRLAQAAAHPADHRLREVEDPVADPRRVHQVAHQDEQRGGQQRERVRRHRDLLRDHDAGDAGERQEGEAGEPHRRVDRGAEEQREEPRPQHGEDQRDHRAPPRRYADHAVHGIRHRVQPHGERRHGHDRVDHAHGDRERRRVDVPVALADAQAVDHQHDGERDRGQRARRLQQRLRPRPQPLASHGHGEVAAAARGDDPAEERAPDEEVAPELVAPGERIVEAVAEDDAGEHAAEHRHEAGDRERVGRARRPEGEPFHARCGAPSAPRPQGQRIAWMASNVPAPHFDSNSLGTLASTGARNAFAIGRDHGHARLRGTCRPAPSPASAARRPATRCPRPPPPRSPCDPRRRAPARTPRSPRPAAA